MPDKIIISYGAMCWLDDIRYIKYNLTTGKWDIDADYYHEFFRNIANLGVNATPFSTYCVGRDLSQGYGLKELCQPWVVNAKGKCDLMQLNDNYFEALFTMIGICNAYNVTPIVNILNACDFNFEDRFEWSPFNPDNNAQKINKFYDADAIAPIKKLVDRLLAEQRKRGAKIIWEIGKEIDNPSQLQEIARLVEQAFMPLFAKYNIPGEQLSMGARTLPPDPVVQTRIRQLITEYLGKPSDDYALRPVHGLCKGPEVLEFAMSELADYSALFSSDGAGRKGKTPVWWTATVNSVFENTKMNSPLVHGTSATGIKRCKASFELFMTDENDIPNVKAVIAACEKRGFKFENKGKFPPVVPPPPPPAECKIGETKKAQCWDGSSIITHVCNNGKWQATNTSCPPQPPPEPPQPQPTTTCGTTAWGHFKRLNFKAWWAHIRGKHNL